MADSHERQQREEDSVLLMRRKVVAVEIDVDRHSSFCSNMSELTADHQFYYATREVASVESQLHGSYALGNSRDK